MAGRSIASELDIRYMRQHAYKCIGRHLRSEERLEALLDTLANCVLDHRDVAIKLLVSWSSPSACGLLLIIIHLFGLIIS